jgi:hypothetical protein
VTFPHTNATGYTRADVYPLPRTYHAHERPEYLLSDDVLKDVLRGFVSLWDASARNEQISSRNLLQLGASQFPLPWLAFGELSRTIPFLFYPFSCSSALLLFWK